MQTSRVLRGYVTNGVAIRTGRNTGLSQVTSKIRIKGNIGTEQGSTTANLCYTSPTHRSDTRSGAEVNYIGRQTQKLLRIFGTDQDSNRKVEDQKPDYSDEFRFPNLSEGVPALCGF
uniref:Uncharacterized protein n=1 Tax=Octactis speculum TaxID=3111310 RepID=A0A7S2B1K0_9STRA